VHYIVSRIAQEQPERFALPSDAEGEEESESQTDAGADASPCCQARSCGLQIIAIRLIEAEVNTTSACFTRRRCKRNRVLVLKVLIGKRFELVASTASKGCERVRRHGTAENRGMLFKLEKQRVPCKRSEVTL